MTCFTSLNVFLVLFLYFVKASAWTFNNVEVVQQFGSENIYLNMVNCKENYFKVIHNIICLNADFLTVKLFFLFP